MDDGCSLFCLLSQFVSVNKNAVMAKLVGADLSHTGQSGMYLSSVLYEGRNVLVAISVAPDGECQNLTELYWLYDRV